MPPPRPICGAVSAFVASSVDRPSATPAPTSAAVRSDARPIAQSQPKKSAPHWMPPKRSRWRARIVSRAAGARTGSWRSTRSSTPSRSRSWTRVVAAPVARSRSRSAAGRRRACGRRRRGRSSRAARSSSRAASSRSARRGGGRRGAGRGRAADGDRAARGRRVVASVSSSIGVLAVTGSSAGGVAPSRRRRGRGRRARATSSRARSSRA